MSSDFDHLGLFARNGVLIDQVLYKPQTTDVAQEKRPNGSATRVFDTLPTPNVTNPPASPPAGTIPARAPGLFFGLRVTEIMYNPLGGNQYEYIELQNTSALRRWI